VLSWSSFPTNRSIMEASQTCRLPAGRVKSASADRRERNRNRFRKTVDARLNGQESTRSAADGPGKISRFLQVIHIVYSTHIMTKIDCRATVRSGSGGANRRFVFSQILPPGPAHPFHPMRSSTRSTGDRCRCQPRLVRVTVLSECQAIWVSSKIGRGLRLGSPKRKSTAPICSRCSESGAIRT
jgi:hypothetical protein